MKMLEDLAEVVAEITPRSPGGPWVAANFIRTHHAEIAQNSEAAKRLHICWGKEVDDIDKIVEKLGLTVEQARTDGGCLHLPRILNHIQETLDALAVPCEAMRLLIAIREDDYLSDSSRHRIDTLVAKQTKNECRVWPDWRTADPSKPIEHDRSHDAPIADVPKTL